ncbi:MAG: amino acid permease [Bdellovibrionota bacterium]
MPDSSFAQQLPPSNNAGPAVTLGYIIAATGCAFAALCYAEFASMLPIAGSAYTYSYATMGEFVAWIIGWDLVLEYAPWVQPPLQLPGANTSTNYFII